MKKTMLLLMGMMFTLGITAASAQEKSTPSPSVEEGIVSHSVALGETVMLISKKYLVKPQDIYDLNPTAVNGISPNSVLRIPTGKSLRPQQPKASPVAEKTKEPLVVKRTTAIGAAH